MRGRKRKEFHDHPKFGPYTVNTADALPFGSVTGPKVSRVVIELVTQPADAAPSVTFTRNIDFSELTKMKTGMSRIRKSQPVLLGALTVMLLIAASLMMYLGQADGNSGFATASDSPSGLESVVRRDAFPSNHASSIDTATVASAKDANDGNLSGRRGCTIRVLADDGLHLAEVRLHVIKARLRLERLRLGLDGACSFRFTGPCVVRVWVPGQSCQYIDVTAPGDYEVRLHRPQLTSRLLVDDDAPGRPIEITIGSEFGSLTPLEAERQMTYGVELAGCRILTDSLGYFALPASFLHSKLRIVLPSHLAFVDGDNLPSNQRVIDEYAASGDSGLQLRAKRLLSVTGVVVDAEGRVITGASVSVSEGSSRIVRTFGHSGSVVTDLDGRFILPLTGSNEAVFEVVASLGGVEARSRAVLGPDCLTDIGAVMIPLSGAMEVVARDSLGGVEKVFVSICGSNVVFDGRTNERIVIAPVPPGPFDVVVASAGREPVVLEDCLVGSAREALLEVAPKLSVVVRGIDSSEIVPVRVAFNLGGNAEIFEHLACSPAQVRAQGYTRMEVNRSRREVVAIALGTGAKPVTFPGIGGAESVTVSVLKPILSYSHSETIAWTGEDVEVVLDLDGWIELDCQVVDSMMRPVGDAFLYVTRGEVGPFRFSVDSKGHCSVFCKRGERIRLEANSPNAASTELVIEKVENESTAVIQLPAPARAELEVLCDPALRDNLMLGASKVGLGMLRVESFGDGRFGVWNPPNWPVSVCVGVGLYRKEFRVALQRTTLLDASDACPVLVKCAGLEQYDDPWLCDVDGNVLLGNQRISSAELETALRKGVHELVITDGLGDHWRTSTRRKTINVGESSAIVVFE